MNKEKVVVFNYSLEMGGTDRVAVELANIFSRNGHDVCFLTFKKTCSDFFTLDPSVSRKHLGFEVDDSSTSGFGYMRWGAFVSFLKLIFFLGKEKPGYLIGNWTSINCLAILAAFFANVKVVCIEHIHFDQPSMLWKVLRRFTYPRAFRIVCLTNADYDDYCRLGGRVVKIYNPLTVSVSGSSKRVGKNFVAVGRLEAQKGFDILIKSFVEVVDKHPDAMLKIYGSGGEERNLNKLIRLSGLSEHVALVGPTKNISCAYINSDFFVLSSRFEGFGLVIIEAQAHGLPVVSFDCPRGPSEIIRDRENGLLVENGSIDALANAMLELLNDRQLCDYMVGNAFKDIARFSHPAIYDEWAKKVFGAPK